jgi:Sperm-tail PG-rich repeat
MGPDKNVVPGPGQYYSYEKFSTINVKKKDPKHQFFSSTEDRFKHSAFAVEDNSTTPARVGPGAYETSGIFDTIERKKKEQSPDKANEIKRIFDIPREQRMMPGPGEYKNTDVPFQKKDFQKAFISAFNTSDARIVNAAKFSISPGPGAYNNP